MQNQFHLNVIVLRDILSSQKARRIGYFNKQIIKEQN
jgi:hypothetical protein